MSVFFFFLCISMYLEPMKASRGHPTPMELGLWVVVSHPGWWELNPGPLQEQQESEPLCHPSHPQELVLFFLTMFT